MPGDTGCAVNVYVFTVPPAAAPGVYVNQYPLLPVAAALALAKVLSIKQDAVGEAVVHGAVPPSAAKLGLKPELG